MFPIFLWVREYKGLKNFKLNLDSNYEVDLVISENLKDKDILFESLDIKINKQIKNFYSKNIDDIKLLIGKNGVGKSTILEILSTPLLKNEEHLMIYKCCDDTFHIEGYISSDDYSFKFLKNKKEYYNPYFNFRITKDNNFIHENLDVSNSEIVRIKDDIEKLNFQKLKIIIDEKGYRKGNVGKYNINLSLKSNVSIYNYLIEEKYIEKNKNLKMILKITDFFISDFFDYLYQFGIEKKEEAEEFRLYKDYDTLKKDGIIKNFCNHLYLNLLKNLNTKLKENLKIKNKKLKEDKYNINEKSSNEILKSLINDISEEIFSIKDLLTNLNLLIDGFEIFLKSSNIEFVSKDIIEIKLEEYDNNIKIFFELLDTLFTFAWNTEGINQDLSRYFKMYIKNISDGEENKIHLFSVLNRLLLGEEKNKKYVTILFDEIGKSLHPEWKRMLLFEIITELEKYPTKKFKLIFATHDVFLLSDILKTDIRIIDNFKCINEKNIINSFGTNIIDIYKNNFFLKSTFGEFSKIKIKKVIELLSKDKNGNFKNIEIEKNKEEIEFVINSIGEDLIRNKLKNMYAEYKQSKKNNRGNIHKKELDEIRKFIEEKGLEVEDIIGVL